jgi:exonuclease VII large subunit
MGNLHETKPINATNNNKTAKPKMFNNISCITAAAGTNSTDVKTIAKSKQPRYIKINNANNQ